MSLTLAHYRLNTLGELRRFKETGGEEFRKYYQAMKDVFFSLPAGGLFDICRQIPEEAREKFVKTACVLIQEHPVDEFEFTDDYLFIRRRNISWRSSKGGQVKFLGKYH